MYVTDGYCPCVGCIFNRIMRILQQAERRVCTSHFFCRASAFPSIVLLTLIIFLGIEYRKCSHAFELRPVALQQSAGC